MSVLSTSAAESGQMLIERGRIPVGTRIPTGILLIAGLVLLVVRPDWSIIAGLLIIAAGVIRIHDLRRGRLKGAPWPLTIIALFMPRPAAHSYLEELGHSASEVCGRERKLHVRHAVAAAPRTLVTVWHCWLRTQLVKLTVWVLSNRVPPVQHLIQDMAASPRQYRTALRRLQRYCRLILCATGNEQFHEYADVARGLLLSCRQRRKNGSSAELDARIRQDVEKLACALTNRRPDRA